MFPARARPRTARFGDKRTNYEAIVPPPKKEIYDEFRRYTHAWTGGESAYFCPKLAYT